MDSQATARVVLLGASNLTLGFSPVLGCAEALLGPPIDVLSARGHGRSYGIRSTILGRTLPGIADCGLWRALEQRPRLPTFALVTDVGNDIGYGVEPSEIAGWVEACIERLARLGSRTVLTLPPVASLEALPRWRYHVARAIFFPRSQLPHAEALARVRELDGLLRRIAARGGAAVVEAEREWYGLDPIHLRRRIRRLVWAEILGRWRPEAGAVLPGRSPLRWVCLHLLRPEEWWLFGSRKGAPQPAGRLPSGTAVSLY